jgi:hypothetical protein
MAGLVTLLWLVVYQLVGILILSKEKESSNPIGIFFIVMFWPIVLIYRALS